MFVFNPRVQLYFIIAQITANHILLSHRVALEAAYRARKTLETRRVDAAPQMRSTFMFDSVSFDLDPEFLHQTCVGRRRRRRDERCETRRRLQTAPRAISPSSSATTSTAAAPRAFRIEQATNANCASLSIAPSKMSSRTLKSSSRFTC